MQINKREISHVHRQPNHIHKTDKQSPGADCMHIKVSGIKQYQLSKMPGTETRLKYTLKGIWLDKYRQEEIFCVVFNCSLSNH